MKEDKKQIKGLFIPTDHLDLINSINTLLSRFNDFSKVQSFDIKDEFYNKEYVKLCSLINVTCQELESFMFYFGDYKSIDKLLSDHM